MRVSETWVSLFGTLFCFNSMRYRTKDCRQQYVRFFKKVESEFFGIDNWKQIVLDCLPGKESEPAHNSPYQTLSDIHIYQAITPLRRIDAHCGKSEDNIFFNAHCANQVRLQSSLNNSKP